MNQIMWTKGLVIMAILFCLVSIHLRIRWHEHIFHKIENGK